MNQRIRTLADTHPVGSAVAITVGQLAIVVAGALVLPDRSAAMAAVVTAALLAAAVGLSLLLGRPPRLGWSTPRQWRRPALLIVPAALALLPLAAGVRPVAAEVLVVLVVGYALTGVAEELLWRGVVLDLLRPRGFWAAALISAGLFGAGHLANVLYRGSLALVLAQAFGARPSSGSATRRWRCAPAPCRR